MSPSHCSNEYAAGDYVEPWWVRPWLPPSTDPWVPDVVTNPGTATITYNYPNPRILYTGGSFDLFHYGHVNFLRACKKIVGPEGKVVVALNTDEFVHRYKKVDCFPYDGRRSVLLSCEYVDEVVPNESAEDSKPTILSVNPDFVAIGTDWCKRDYYAQMNFTQEWLDEQNITLIYIPYTEGISSSIIRDQLERL